MTGRTYLGAVAAVALLTAAAPALGNHISGATYVGNFPSGGTMEFDVAPDGSGVTRFAVANVATECGTVTSQTTGNVPITDHSFAQSSGALQFSGTFPGTQTAQGTFQYKLFGYPSCTSSVFNWNASTTSQPSSQPAGTPPPPPAPPPEPAPTAGQPEPAPAANPISLAAGSAQVHGSRALVPVECQSDARCIGVLALQNRRRGTLVAVPAKSRKRKSRRKRRTVTYAKGRVRVPAGKTRGVRARLTGRGKKLVRRGKARKVWANITIGKGKAAKIYSFRLTLEPTAAKRKKRR